MSLPIQKFRVSKVAEGGMDWLVNVDLSSFIAARKKDWTKKCLAVDRIANDEPWRRIQDPDVRAYVILLWLQNTQLRLELKRQAERTRDLHEVVPRFKAALQEEILHGVNLSLYGEAWGAWGSENAETVKQLRETIESKRAEWRAKCEIEAKEEVKQRMRRDAEILRERAPGYRVNVNWFAPMPIYNHTVFNGETLWGYCQATGQDRKKVGAYLTAKNQRPIEHQNRRGAGRKIPLYGFETNLLVLEKWLGDWLLTSPDRSWLYQDSTKPGKTLCLPKPERVCEAIYDTVSHTAGEEHTDAQAEQFRAILWKHMRRWKGRVKDPDTRRIIPFLEATLSPAGRAWKDFAQQQRAQFKQIMDQVRDEMQNRGPMPYAEVFQALRRYQELLG